LSFLLGLLARATHTLSRTAKVVVSSPSPFMLIHTARFFGEVKECELPIGWAGGVEDVHELLTITPGDTRSAPGCPAPPECPTLAWCKGARFGPTGGANARVSGP
jgi:hypothetical protein